MLEPQNDGGRSIRELAARPIPTTLYKTPDAFAPIPGCAYLYGSTDEQRSDHLVSWSGRTDVEKIPVHAQIDAVVLTMGTKDFEVSLHSARRLDAVWEHVPNTTVYIDITGLPHHAWAPLIHSALRSEKTVNAVYVEPLEYKSSREPHQLYDLSEGINGINALPGFKSLLPTYDNFCFIPLLGFEETRFSYVFNTVDPVVDRVYPVIGVPGFRPEYPFETYRSNLRMLEREQGKLALKVQFADAACPFRLFYVLQVIAASHPTEVLKIALLGTKPHALGAVLYAIDQGREAVELVYDHPIRKSGRTRGTGRLLVYHLSAFIPTPLKTPKTRRLNRKAEVTR